jgi:predicted KAP-like P-loop ATPase
MLVWADRESEIDYLNFGEVSKMTVDILTAEGMLPISIGIFGNWGAGKSSLLKLVEKDLKELKDSNGKDNKYIIVNFDAWLYQGYDDARISILEIIATELNEAAKGNKTLLEKTKGLLGRINVFRALGWAAEGVALLHGVPTGGLLARGIGSSQKLFEATSEGSQITPEDYESLKKEVQEGKDAAKELLKDSPKITPPQQIAAFRKEYSEVLAELERPLIVIIDNLDRCLPSNAIHTLEAIRLFLFLPNTAFIIAADEDMIRGAVADYFKGTSDRHQIDYIDKLIQIPIRVPKAGIREIRSYLFMLLALQNGISKDNLEKLRSKLEESLQQSWKEDPIETDSVINLLDAKNNESLILAFELADRITPILATYPSIKGNPRIVKRLLNVIKMRANVARRRGIPLDESLIAKLVIFERCAGVDVTSDFYQLIDSEAGRPKVLEDLESLDEDQLPANVPVSWTKNPSTVTFIREWSKLEPKLKGVDLRGAIYLSRETIPIGVYVMGLSPNGQEALKVLAQTGNTASPSAQKVLSTVPPEEQVPVMEGLINHLRQTSDWKKQPNGFAGACLLANSSTEASKLLSRYVRGISNQPVWLKTMLKNQKWYEES